jgi:hypothetical protein
MSRLLVVLMLGSLAAASTGCSKPREPVTTAQPVSPARPLNPAEYKLSFRYHELEESATLTGDLIFREGRIYLFFGGSEEVVLIDPAIETVRLLDIRRRATAELKFATINAAIERYRKDLRDEIAAAEARNTRADRIEAAMDRDLLEPHFKIEANPDRRRIRLTNPTVEVDATGEPEEDGAKRQRMAEALAVMIKLRALRFPDAIPPFSQLDTLTELISARRLRPVEMSFLFRLTGPPEKYVWSYRFVPTLTAREWEAIGRIDALLPQTARMSFERYERLIDRVRLH